LIRFYPKLSLVTVAALYAAYRHLVVSSDVIRVPVLNEYHLVTFQTFNYNPSPFIKELVALQPEDQ